jgi:hypothetical protein
LNNACHLVYLNSSDHVLIQNVDLGPMCCDGDAVEIAVPRNGAPNPSNVVLDHLYIHDIYDSCARAARFGSCTVTGFGSGCGSCDHVDGIQAFGGTNITISNSRVYSINPGGPVGQGIFFAPANGGSFANLTLQNNMVDSMPNNDTSFVGPGNSWYSGSINLLYNTFRGDLAIYPYAVAAGTPITVTGNVIGAAVTGSPAPLCSLKAGDGSTLTPVFSYNLIGNTTCSSTDIQGIATYNSINPQTPDLRLQASSLGIDRGDPFSFPSVDIFGNPRPAGAGPDIGAAER